MKRETNFKLILLIAFIFSLLAQHAASADEIRIGATLPLSGDLATYGNLIRNGIELATEDLGKEGIQTKTFYIVSAETGSIAIWNPSKVRQNPKEHLNE